MKKEVEQWALDFYSELFRGEHHIQGGRRSIKEYGTGYALNYLPVDLATFDFNGLTRAVLIAHRDCIRVEIGASSAGRVKLIVHKRHKREGRMEEKHPTIEQAIEAFNF